MKALAPLSLARWFTPAFSARRPDVLDWVRKILYQQDAEFHAALWEVIANLATQARLPGLSRPALVVVGAEDASTPVAAAQALAEALGTVRVEVVPNASHLINLEAPHKVNDLLTSFWASLA